MALYQISHFHFINAASPLGKHHLCYQCSGRFLVTFKWNPRLTIGGVMLYFMHAYQVDPLTIALKNVDNKR